MNKLQVLALREIELSAGAAEGLLHKISRERLFVGAICNFDTPENDLMALLWKIKSLADAISEEE